MPKHLNVLYGFTSDKIQQSIAKEITLRGYIPKGVKMTTKELQADYLKNHPEVDVVILKEYLDGGGVYSALELTQLVDELKHVNIVIVLATNHRGKNEMKELYSAGILNAFFSDGKFGANPDKLAELACKGRTRKEARQYYKIDDVIPDHINITFEEFRDNYRYLVDDKQGMNIINRFVQISRMLYPGQMGAFIDRLPDNVKMVLMKYREFYDIANKVYKMGYAKEKYKVPKDAVVGITKEAIAEELVKDGKARSKPFEPELTSVKSSSVVVKEEEYEEPIGLDRVIEKEQEMPSVSKEEEEAAEVATEKPKKKGLFGRRTKEKKEKKNKKVKGEERRESIFEQESDVDFELEGVSFEPVEDTDSWGGSPEPETETLGEPVDNAHDTVNHGHVGKTENTEQSIEVQPPAAEDIVPEVSEEEIEEAMTGIAGETSGGSVDDLDSLSVEELKKLLGN